MPARKKRDPKTKPPVKKAVKIRVANQVLDEAAKGGDWWARVIKNVGKGRAPRFPGTTRAMNAEELLNWAIRAFSSDEAKHQRAARVAAELERIGFADAGNYGVWGNDGLIVTDSDKLDRDQRAAVASVKADKDGKLELKLHDKLKALHLLGQTTSMFEVKHVLSGPNNGPIEVKDRSNLDRARLILALISEVKHADSD